MNLNCRPKCTAVFLGCSITFGVGVEDNETIPSQFAKYAPDYFPVNAGFSGYGLQHIWLQLTEEAFLNKLPHKNGIVVYTFIDDHINRLKGTPAVLTGWNYPLPWLESDDGSIQHRGTFADRDRLRYYIYRYLGRMHLYRFLASRFGHQPITESDDTDSLDLAADIIRDAARRLAELRPEMHLYVVLFPGSVLGKQISARLKNTPVTIINYTSLLDDTGVEKERLFFADSPVCEWGHPKALSYDFVAKQLAQDVAECD